jgi:uncharacterized protein (UPF0264 family)
MQLLVSVADADDASAALAGGADIIDAKDPSSGPLGAVTPQVFSAIARTVNGTCMLSAALGEPSVEEEATALARAFVAAGAAFVKIGFGPTTSTVSVRRLLHAVKRAAPGHIIAVAYADAGGDLSRMRVLEAAEAAGSVGVLLDTMDKQGPGLCQLLTLNDIHAWVARVRTAGLMSAVAGRLTLADVAQLRGCGADVAGVRGAACTGGRGGRVVGEKVRELRDACAARDVAAATQHV